MTVARNFMFLWKYKLLTLDASISVLPVHCHGQCASFLFTFCRQEMLCVLPNMSQLSLLYGYAQRIFTCRPQQSSRRMAILRLVNFYLISSQCFTLAYYNGSLLIQKINLLYFLDGLLLHLISKTISIFNIEFNPANFLLDICSQFKCRKRISN